MAAFKRLGIEAKQLETSPPDFIRAKPSEREGLLVFHYVITGPPDTPYHGGHYHGVLLFPKNYPMGPPEIRMYTPSGRFEPNKPLCLSMSNYHPETWVPSWSVSTVLVGLLSFMVGSERTAGSIFPDPPPAEKEALARVSLAYNVANNKDFCALFPDLVEELERRKAGVAPAVAAATGGSSTTTAAAAEVGAVAPVAAAAEGGDVAVAATAAAASAPAVAAAKPEASAGATTDASAAGAPPPTGGTAAAGGTPGGGAASRVVPSALVCWACGLDIDGFTRLADACAALVASGAEGRVRDACAFSMGPADVDARVRALIAADAGDSEAIAAVDAAAGGVAGTSPLERAFAVACAPVRALRAAVASPPPLRLAYPTEIDSAATARLDGLALAAGDASLEALEVTLMAIGRAAFEQHAARRTLRKGYKTKQGMSDEEAAARLRWLEFGTDCAAGWAAAAPAAGTAGDAAAAAAAPAPPSAACVATAMTAKERAYHDAFAPLREWRAGVARLVAGASAGGAGTA